MLELSAILKPLSFDDEVIKVIATVSLQVGRRYYSGEFSQLPRGFSEQMIKAGLESDESRKTKIPSSIDCVRTHAA